jgi:hypothetical protein
MTTALAVYTPQKQREIVELMGFKGTAAQTTLLFQLAEHYGLDPLIKEITLIPGKGPFIGVWGRIHIAQRSGMLDGLEMDDEEEDERHYKVRCVVWRKDQSHPAAKVVGRVGKHERKDWPFEIARARAVRAATGYAFSIHDAYDHDDEDWSPAPDERMQASVVPPQEEVRNGGSPAAPKRARKVNKQTGEVVDIPAPTEPKSGAGEPAGTGETSASTTPSRPDPAPDTEPATVVVGGHTIAQKIAIAARDAGIDDDQTRHDVIRAASRSTYQRGSDIPEDGYDPDLVDRIFAAFDGLKTGGIELRYEPDGTPKLYKVRR